MSRGRGYGVLFAVTVALPLQGQTVVRGTLTEAGTGAPLEGAVVALVRPQADSSLTRVLSDASGAFSLIAPPGRWRVRAEVMGHRTVYTDPFELESHPEHVVALSAPVEALALDDLDVTASTRRCMVRPEDDGLATARLWDQVRRALENSAVGQERQVARYEAVLWERDLDPRTLEIERESAQVRRSVGPRPVTTASPRSLAEQGFVQSTDSGTYYFAPDEHVLLSDTFLEGHCFRLLDSAEDEELVGLAFEPVGGSGRVDVDGVLWLDGQTQELRSLEYRYVNLELGVRTTALGGGLSFQRLPNGVWIPSKWYIRMPRIEIRRTGAFGRERERQVLAGILELGGEISSVETGGVRLENLDRPRVQGIVFDSTRALPLAGARVFLIGTTHETVTGRDGRFVLTATEGDFFLSFEHQRLAALGLESPRTPVSMRPSAVRQVRLYVPSVDRILVQECAPTAPGPVLTGVVRDSTGRALAGATVTLGWPASDRPGRWRTASAESDGSYVFCGAPVGTAVVVRATRSGLTSAEHVVQLATEGVVREDLQVDVRTGRLRGRVTDATTGQALQEAAVRILGTGQETLTDSDGRFALTDVPPGRQLVQLGHILYDEQSRALDVQEDADLWLDASLAEDALELDPLTITVEANRAPGLTGFHLRADRGYGFILTEERIERLHAIQMSDVFNAVPGLTVACGDPSVLGSGCIVAFERARSMSGRCPVQYFLDGSTVSKEMVETLNPRSLAGVEVYNGLSEVPPIFRRGPDTRCGVIAVWLRARR